MNINPLRLMRERQRAWQKGVYAVEFSIVLIVILTFIFAVMELARAMFLFNTLQDVTRTAALGAATADYRDDGAMARVRQRAIFRTTPGLLVVGDPVTDEYVRIDYLALVRGADGSMTMTPISKGAWPSCTARNRQICMQNPNDATCMRLVRARICKPGGEGSCDKVDYVPLMPLLSFPVTLPVSSTIVPAGTLGYEEGETPCP